ncbi:hypothetical protein SPSYN_02655 [Sporotomaculum syntrophicum]|uniref:DUF1294 domain-containing protein n=1 Tax=Sporotomaculum syntrophicum TaxID=182264 RepID=A0A9D3AXB8_9FIRM|nr:hypothetical protein SPSYN_02655 [Sporotomaculum syntrophicum]
MNTYLLVINIIAFILFGWDKHCARHQLYRVSEKILFLIALAGGTVGSLVGMYIWHHKTKHLQFTIGIPVLMLVQILLYYYSHAYL